MDASIIIPAGAGILTALITQFVAIRLQKGEVDARTKKINKEAEEVAMRIAAELRQQLLGEIDRLNEIVDNQWKELNILRKKTIEQQKIITALRLELSETESRYQRQIDDLQVRLNDCYDSAKSQRDEWEKTLEEYKMIIHGLKVQLKGSNK